MTELCELQNVLHTIENISCCVLTPNERLSLYLQQKYAAYQIRRGKKTWLTPHIFSLATWLKTYFQTLSYPALLLNHFQEKICWENIIRNNRDRTTLLNISETANMAQNAALLLQEWQAMAAFHNTPLNQDQEIFKHWLKIFNQYCYENHCTVFSSIPTLCHLAPIEKYQQYLLIGFDVLAPNYERLFSSIRDQGCVIRRIDLEIANPTKPSRLACPDVSTEFYQAATWAKNLADHTTQPISIGIVVPQLVQQRYEVERVFNEVCGKIINISAGKSLSAYPLINSALMLLRWLITPLTLEEVSCLLRSPFFGHAEQEITERALLDKNLHAQQHPLVSLWTAQQLASSCMDLNEKFKILLEKFSHCHGKLLASAWIPIMQDLLATIGWPGERLLDSGEYQQQQRWTQLLEEDFAQLNVILPTMDFQQALQYLTQLAHETIFQPPSTVDAPIQILGMLEASGLLFDHLWITGLNSDNWPGPARPNPFIPLTLQRQLQMPHASAIRELEFSQLLTERFCHSATEVIFSYPMSEQDRLLDASPLIRGFPPAVIPTPTFAGVNSCGKPSLKHTSFLEMIIDDRAPPLTNNEHITGGVSVLKQQAACPFQAFAVQRLGAKTLEKPHLGFNAKQRGILLHQLLESIWQQLGNHHYLCALSKQQLSQLVQNTIIENLKIYAKFPFKKSANFLNLEQQRLQTLLLNWLNLEKNRVPFQIHALEQKQFFQFANLKLTVKIDRIDQLADGSHLVIDYKTGQHLSMNDWLGDRPSEPQLPLYSLTENLQINGLAFAKLTAKESKWINMTIDAKQKAQWQNIMTQLGHQFSDGHAQVDPKDGHQTCKHCSLSTFCRIHEHDQ